jgi:hypothetical protein
VGDFSDRIFFLATFRIGLDWLVQLDGQSKNIRSETSPKKSPFQETIPEESHRFNLDLFGETLKKAAAR